MKIIITENRFNETIKSYILKNYPLVKDVYFTTKTKWLGSSPELSDEERIVTENVVNIIIDNYTNSFSRSQISTIKREIWTDVDDMFSLETMEYGSKWDFQFYILITEKI